MDIYEEISLFFKEPVESVKAKSSQAHHRLNKLWAEDDPRSEDERMHWYRTSDGHIYEGANWHSGHLMTRKAIASAATGKILCFGSGIGTEGIMAAEMGKDVTFYDLQGLVFDFLKFRVGLRALGNCRFIDEELRKTGRNGSIFYESDAFDMYDTIICIDVLEHLEHPQEVLNFLAARLNPDGSFLVSSPFCELEYKGHLPKNAWFDIDLMMKLAGIKNYRKDILCGDNLSRRAPGRVKGLILNAAAALPVKSALKHRLIFFLTPTRAKIKIVLLKVMRALRRS